MSIPNDLVGLPVAKAFAVERCQLASDEAENRLHHWITMVPSIAWTPAPGSYGGQWVPLDHVIRPEVFALDVAASELVGEYTETKFLSDEFFPNAPIGILGNRLHILLSMSSLALLLPPAPTPKRRGAPGFHDWAGLAGWLAMHMHYDGIPEHQAKLARLCEQYFLDRRMPVPDTRELQRFAARAWDAASAARR